MHESSTPSCFTASEPSFLVPGYCSFQTLISVSSVRTLICVHLYASFVLLYSFVTFWLHLFLCVE